MSEYTCSDCGGGFSEPIDWGGPSCPWCGKNIADWLTKERREEYVGWNDG